MYRRDKQARLLTNGIIGPSTDTTLGDEHWNDVSLLIRGDTLTDLTGNHTPVANNGAAAGDTSPVKFASGSMSFDGVNDFISIPDSELFEFGSGDFTVEAWVYHNGSLAADLSGWFESPFGKLAADNSPDGFYFAAENTGKMRFIVGDGSNGQVAIVDTANFPINQWVHLAGTREGNKFTLWVNGVSRGTTTTTSFSLSNNSTPFYVGVMTQSGVQSWHYWNGNIEDLRVTKGVARYTQNFKPPVKSFPAQPLGLTVPVAGDDFWDDVSLLIRGDTLTDLSDNAHTVSENGSTPLYNDTTTKKYASGSLTFDGSGDYVSVPDDPSLELGSGDFTIECWAYHSGTLPTKATITGKRSDYSDYAPYLINADTTNPDKKMRFLASAGSNWDIIITDTHAFPYDQWVHVAVTRAGNVFTLWINGESKVTTTAAITLMDNSAPLYIGRGSANTGADLHDWNGNIEDFRITKGVARYTQNFTPPTASFLTNAPSTTTTGRRGVGTYDNSIEYLIVGGGGGGGADVASGGGAGGVIAGSSTNLLNSGSYSISIGAGGAGATVPAADGVNGGDTTAFGLTALGGGGGGGGAGDGQDGGSGGGGNPVGSGTSGQGNDGGLPLHSTPYFNGGGGGGKTSAGGDATTSKGGDGGDGILWLDGNYYGGGGGGGWLDNTGASGSLSNRGGGGLGGGGDGGISKGSTVIASATSGAANTGGGGGGGGWQVSSNDDGGSGGSGVVLLRYPSSITLTISGGLTATHDTTTSPGYTITKFTSGSGTVEASGDPASTLRTRGYIGAAPAAVAGDEHWNDVSLLIRGDSLTDLSGNHTPVANNGAAAGDTSPVKFASGSMSFDGVNDYISIPDSDLFAFGSGDFTIEFWAYHIGSFDRYTSVCGNRASGNHYGPFGIVSGGDGAYDNQIRFFAGEGTGSTNSVMLIDPDDFPLNQWVHLAVTREGTTFTLWINGQSKATGTGSWSMYNASEPMYLGKDVTAAGANMWNGNIEDFRVTKGVARYTSDFTPPTASFPNNASQRPVGMLTLYDRYVDTLA